MTASSSISPQLVAGIASGLIVLRWGAEIVLAQLNQSEVAKNASRIPDAYSGIMDDATYRKSVDYTLTRSRFGTAQEIAETALLLIVLFSGVLPWAFEFTTSVFGAGIWGSATALFTISLALSVPGIPWNYYDQFVLEQRFGFNTTTTKTWITDKIKGLALGSILGIPLIAFLLKMVEIAGEKWWLCAWAGILCFQALLMLIAPAVIMPLFNKFTPLPDGSLKDRLWKLAERTGFSAQSIQVMDGSKRSRHSNAFFTGFGRFRKIVLFDTLTEQLNDSELEAVLAHEMGHFKLKHIPKLLLTSALGLLVSFFILHLLSTQSWFYVAFGFSTGSIAPAFMLFFLLSGTVSFWISPLFNRTSRKHEYEADAFAVRAVRSADPLISSLRRLSEKNLSNLTPHPAYSAFYYSHPTLIEREAAMRAVSL